jgi:hypothetical protein
MIARAATSPLITGWRGFHEALRRAAVAATASQAPLALLMIEPGGLAWSARCRRPAVVSLLAAKLGGQDVLARYSRERLGVIMADADLGAALARAEGFADLFSAPAIGIAEFDDDEALGHLILRAQDALARARARSVPAVALAGRAEARRAALAGAGRSGAQ